MSGVLVTVEYVHPDNDLPTRYMQRLTTEQIGTLLLVVDALADADPDRIERICRAVSE